MCRKVSAGMNRVPNRWAMDRCCRLSTRKAATGDPVYDRWLATNVEEQRQHGYAIVTALLKQGNLTAHQMRGLATIARQAGDGTLRVTIDQNVLIPFVQLGNLPRVYAALTRSWSWPSSGCP